MKKLLMLFALMLFISVFSVFAQRGAGNGGNRTSGGGTGNRPAQGSPRNDDSSQRRSNPDNRRDQGAENSRRRGEDNQPNHGKLLKGIGLSDEQKQQIKQIQKDGKENGTSSEEIRSHISQVLTPEQKAKLDERIEKIRERKDKKKEQQNQPEQPN